MKVVPICRVARLGISNEAVQCEGGESRGRDVEACGEGASCKADAVGAGMTVDRTGFEQAVKDRFGMRNDVLDCPGKGRGQRVDAGAAGACNEKHTRGVDGPEGLMVECRDGYARLGIRTDTGHVVDTRRCGCASVTFLHSGMHGAGDKRRPKTLAAKETVATAVTDPDTMNSALDWTDPPFGEPAAAPGRSSNNTSTRKGMIACINVGCCGC